METTNIYVLIDPRTNMVRYVGKANDVTQRYRAHLNRARDGQTHKRNWINSLRKLGLKPILEVIDEVPINEWVFWETYWIHQMKVWGFNLTNNTNGGDGLTCANENSFKKGQGGKKVVGYNSNYEKEYEFDTAEDATRFFKTHRSSIPRCANGKGKTIKNIAWFYYDDIKDICENDLIILIKIKFKKEIKQNSGTFIKGQKSFKSKKVLMYDLEWNFIRDFESAKLAGEYIGVTGGAIQFACIKSKKNECKKYKWKYERKEN